ncbi:TPA: hypothetical protein TXV04_002247 [Streptococcus suis]|nr:hypothetical protein [Streptococcus suis]HEL1769078.1 hypothetical protein [Streptococcus suis]HEL2303706.1 hypothetical protein [Streptococcus suis]HEM5181776.1 hypothetical protein [Streptococcus suis]
MKGKRGMKLSELADLLLATGSFLAGLGAFISAIKKKPSEQQQRKS